MLFPLMTMSAKCAGVFSCSSHSCPCKTVRNVLFFKMPSVFLQALGAFITSELITVSFIRLFIYSFIQSIYVSPHSSLLRHHSLLKHMLPVCAGYLAPMWGTGRQGLSSAEPGEQGGSFPHQPCGGNMRKPLIDGLA